MKQFRSLAFVGVLICASFAHSQDLAKKVSFDEPAGAADKVIADLAKQTGTKLETNHEMSKEVLLICVKEVPLSELLKRIAAVTSGRWDQIPNGYRLNEDAALRQTQEAIELKAKAETIRAAFEKQRKQATGDKPEPPTSPDATFAGFGGSTIAQDLLYAIDPMVLAGLGPDDRIVFSSNPTAMQLQLPPVPEDKIQQFVKDHNNKVAEMQKADEAAKVDANSEQAKEMMAQMGMDQMMKPITGPPAKILLAVKSGGLMGGKNADLRFYDRNGKVIYTDRTMVPDDSGFMAQAMQKVMEAQGHTKSAPAETAKGTPIQFSPVAAELSTIGNGQVMSGSMPKLSPELEARLLHPETYDPLSFAPSEALKAVALEKHEPLVADLPDSLQGLFDSMKKGITTTEYLALIQKLTHGVTVAEKDSWIQIAPKAPAGVRTSRFDRGALSVLINASHSKGSTSLDDMAEFALSSETPDFNGPEMIYLMIFAPNTLMATVFGGNDWQTLRLYGLLSGPQRDTLKNGGTLSRDALTPEQVTVLKNIVYGGKANLEVTRPGEPPKSSKGFLMEMMTQFMPSQQSDYLQEPTEALPQGLPASVTLRDAFSSQTAVKPVEKDNRMVAMFGTLGVEEYSMFKFFSTQSGYQSAAAQMPRLDKFQVGTRSIHDLTIQLLPNVAVKRQLKDDSIAADAATVSANDLPADFNKAVAAKMEEMKKMPFMSAGMLGGGQKLPPL